MKTKALFLDRDGVINIDKNYLFKVEECEFLPNLWSNIKKVTKKYELFVVTNQSGIARGYYKEEDFHILSEYISSEFKKHELIIKKTYFCPHLNEGCECRKPKPGMILKAKKEHDLSLRKSALIGDKLSDIQAGFKAGVGKLVLLSKSLPCLKYKSYKFTPFSKNESKKYKKFIKIQAKKRKVIIQLGLKKARKAKTLRQVAFYHCINHAKCVRI